MLIIPAIYYSQGRSLLTIRGEAGMEQAYQVPPAVLARLWRGENAKSLHVVDMDAARDSVAPDFSVLEGIVASVDIPVQFMGGALTIEEMSRVISSTGVYRLVLTEAQSRDAEYAARCLATFGPRKVVGSIRLCLCNEDGCPATSLDQVVDLARDLRHAGIDRILLSIGETCQPSGSRDVSHELDVLVFLAEATRLRMTLHGWIQDYAALEILQHMNLTTVDSAILDIPLYHSRFPCQAIWRKAEKKLHQNGRFP